MRRISFFIIIFMIGFPNLAISQLSQEELEKISQFLEIRKEMYFYSLESVNSIEEIVRSTKYLYSLLNNNPRITQPNAKFLFKESDISFYKFTTIGRTVETWVDIFAIDTLKNINILEDSNKFFDDLSNWISCDDSLKLLHLSNIYIRVIETIDDVHFYSDLENLPFRGFAVDEEYFKITPIQNGYMYRTFFEQNTEISFDQNIVTLILEKNKFSIREDLYKRIPK